MRKGSVKFNIVLASKNLHKVREIEALIGDVVNIQPMAALLNVEIPELGRTLLENSLAKASFVYRLCGKPVLADDSGLFVDSLGGEPGIYSARYGRTDQERIARLLKSLINKEDRSAAFRVVFVYYDAPGRYEVFEGKCVGRIADAPKGGQGFGYDPVFVPRGYKKTFAELGPGIKNRISHRARALRKFRKFLTQKGDLNS